MTFDDKRKSRTGPTPLGAEESGYAPTLEALVRWRRDVRRFRRDPVPAELIDRLLRLADLAPSVGNIQPWRVLMVEDARLRTAVRSNFEAARAQSAAIYADAAREQYLALKLAGFDAAPVHLAVFSDRGTEQGRGLGRQTMPETLDQSCACMITVLWLAAREAGLGLGWVSILDPDAVGAALGAPEGWKLVGYLLLGWPEEEHLDPELERHGWQGRTPFETRVFAGAASDRPAALMPVGRTRVVSDGPAGNPCKMGSITLVGAGPGDPDLLTVKAVRALAQADAVLYDDLVAKPLLALVRKGAELIDVGKRGYRVSCKQPDINAQLVALALEGKRVVRLKGGDPLIFGRAGEEIAAARAAGIAVEVIPGITSAQGAAARLGVSLTHRDHARRLQFITAHDRHGRLPPDIDWSAVADSAATTVVYMPKRTLPELTEIAMRRGLAPETPAIAVANATRPDEQVILSTVGRIAGDLHSDEIDGPVLVMIGEALREAMTAEPNAEAARRALETITA
ncbi:MAG: uroporphyrinogen-III C-methyltransferase [Hyphomicrobium sp.]